MIPKSSYFGDSKQTWVCCALANFFYITFTFYSQTVTVRRTNVCIGKQQVSWKKKYVTFLFLYSKICVLEHSSVLARVWSFCKIRLGPDVRWRNCVTWVYFQHLCNGFCNQLSHKHLGCNINSVSCHLRRLCISSSSAPHPQNMFENPLTWIFLTITVHGFNWNLANFDLLVLLNGYWFLLFGFVNFCQFVSNCQFVFYDNY